MVGIGRECGSAKFSPRCRRRSRTPASMRAPKVKGGVFTLRAARPEVCPQLPLLQTKSMSDVTCRQGFSTGFYALRVDLRASSHKIFALGRTSTGRELGALGSKKGLCVSGSGSSEPPIERYTSQSFADSRQRSIGVIEYHSAHSSPTNSSAEIIVLASTLV